MLARIDAKAGEIRASLLSGVSERDLTRCMKVFQQIRKSEVSA